MSDGFLLEAVYIQDESHRQERRERCKRQVCDVPAVEIVPLGKRGVVNLDSESKPPPWSLTECLWEPRVCSVNSESAFCLSLHWGNVSPFKCFSCHSCLPLYFNPCHSGRL